MSPETLADIKAKADTAQAVAPGPWGTMRGLHGVRAIVTGRRRIGEMDAPSVADHVAACDPATISAIVDHIEALEARRARICGCVGMHHSGPVRMVSAASNCSRCGGSGAVLA